MAKKTVDQIDVRGKRVLMRVDFNVPLDRGGSITDDRRIEAALPTIRSVLDRGGKLILMSHLGRPKGEPEARYSLAPVARRLGELLGKDVVLAPDCVGDAVNQLAGNLGDSECLLLENLRFCKQETIKDKDASSDPALRSAKNEFAEQLASLADVYVNDAFGTCHRDNASMLTVPQVMKGKPRVAGFLINKELKFLGDALGKPKRPFVVLLGGAKVSDKIGVIESLLQRCDTILIGGAMAFTFQKAQGVATGDSLVEPDFVDKAAKLKATGGDQLHLPVDSVVASKIDSSAQTTVVEGAIPDGQMGLDIGPQTIAQYEKLIAGAATIFWNGPMGVFETQPFDRGTIAMAEAVARATDSGATSIIGGGDSASAIDQAGVTDRVSHVSTGGGASLEFLEGKIFAALGILDDA